MDINKILAANPRSSAYGAPMGARDDFDPEHPVLYVQRVMMVDGDYAPDGTYWGGGRGVDPLWCGFNEVSRVYTRAPQRNQAILNIVDDYPEAEFHTGLDVATITLAFIECLCWAESGDDDAPLGEWAQPADLAPGMEDKAREFVKDFVSYALKTGCTFDYLTEDQIGHDIWLTQRGHGTGFWDRGLGQQGQDLTDAAKTFSMECYLGDDGLIYLD